MNITAIRALVRNDLRLYISDRRSVIVGVLVPICIAAFFGYVFSGSGRNHDVGTIPIGFVDEDHSGVSRAIAADFGKEALVEVRTLDRAAAAEQVRGGKLQAAIVLPKGFAEITTKALFTGANKATVVLLVDPSQATSARIIEGVLAQYAMQEISREAFSGKVGLQVLDDLGVEIDRQVSAGAKPRPELRQLLQAGRAWAAERSASTSGDSDTSQRQFGFSIPYQLSSTEMTARDDTPYNSYAHSFAGMSVQFILFAGIDAGVLLLLTRQRDLAAPALRAATQSRVHTRARARYDTDQPVSDCADLFRSDPDIQSSHSRQRAGVHGRGHCFQPAQRCVRADARDHWSHRIHHARHGNHGDTAAGNDRRCLGTQFCVPGLVAASFLRQPNALGGRRIRRHDLARVEVVRSPFAHVRAAGERGSLPGDCDLALSLGGIARRG